MWMEPNGMEPNGMELNGRKELLNLTPAIEAGLATFNGSVIYGTHDGKVVERGKRNGKMA